MSSNFLQSMAVLEGARAGLKVGAVSKGERVGFICDLRVEPDVIYAFFAAANELGRLLSCAWSTGAEAMDLRMSLSKPSRRRTFSTSPGRWRTLWSLKPCGKSVVFDASDFP